ncbi:MAG: polysaccharide biosynthesis tyrosine autokinase [Bacteroidaceae bacterium]|nr:polysaccharide biosynthesis tyrosine autokinase [Bacteroidaceae bacterium]
MAETTNKKSENFLTIIDLWRLCITRWRWFVASMIICLLFAVKHLVTAPYLYSRSATIMLREDVTGNNASDRSIKDFNEIGFVNQKNKVTDIVRHFTSLDVLLEVASRSEDSLSWGEVFSKAEDIQSRLSVECDGKESNIINLSYLDFSTAEAERILTLILTVYSEKWILDKQEIIRSTSRFIDSKLDLLERELDIVDDSISSYKSRFGITEIENVSNIYLQQQSEADAEILKLSNQKAMAEYIRSLLEDESAQQQLLLVNSGINNTLIESQITLYNSLLLQMQSHMEYTSGQNPLIINLEKELESLRKNIYANVTNHIRTIDIQLNSLQSYHGETSSKISSKPTQAKHLISIEREQKVKESLYLYLLQKKEENEISLTYQSAPIRIIDIPHGSGKPTSPKRMMVLFASLFIGFLLPLTFLFIQATFDETVHKGKDITSYPNINLAGIIPEIRHERTLSKLYRIITHREHPAGIVVANGLNNNVNEAFRRIRTKIEQMTITGSDKEAKVFMVTSFNKNAGKTFVSTNLAVTLAIHQKHVLFIDADLRHGSASQIFRTDGFGFADYLKGTEQQLSSLLHRHPDYPTLDILPAGTLPSNPTELLASAPFTHLIESLRTQYDIVLIDTPHADEFTDAEIIEQQADVKLFVARAGLLKRQRLEDLVSMQEEEKAKPLTVVLNAVENLYYKS